MKPLISVIVPVKNGYEYIEQALESVERAFDTMAYEVIIVNDGSTDKTEEVLQSWHSKIRYFSQKNQGVAAARNLGLQHAKGELVSFIDADDIWSVDHVRDLYGVLQKNSELEVALGYTQRVSKAQDAVFSSPVLGFDLYQPPVLLPSLGAALFKKSVFTKVGQLEPTLRWHEDLDWYLRFIEHGFPIGITKEVVSYYRLHNFNATHDLLPGDAQLLRVLAQSLKRRNNKEVPSLKSLEK